jgi:ABC-type multidrug transport system fused ATPase/permease subunit
MAYLLISHVFISSIGITHTFVIAMVPALLGQAMANSAEFTKTLAYASMLSFAPLLRILFQYATQRRAEVEFIKQRKRFFETYSSTNTSEKGLFNQVAYIKKEGFRLLYFDTPNSLILIFVVVTYALTQPTEYRFAIFFAIISGACGFCASVIHSKNTTREIADADTPPTRMKEQFTSSYLTFKNPDLYQFFLKSFDQVSNISKSKFLKFFWISIAPGSIAELSAQVCMAGSLVYIWHTSGNFYQLVPLFFQVGALMATFSSLTASYPTISAYLNENACTESHRPKFFCNPRIDSKGVTIPETDVIFRFGKRYQIHGPNGCGKSSFLEALAESLLRRGVKIAFLNQKTDIGLLSDTAPLSDGERQSRNFYHITNTDFDLLILDEALASIDKERKTQVFQDLNNLNPGKIIILVDHSSETNEFEQVDFEKQLKFLGDRP